MKIGARILKTGLAITLALTIAQLLSLPSPLFAGIAAIAVQPSVYRSYLSLVEQIQANVIGAAFAVIFVLVFGNHPFIIGLVAVLVIGLCLKLRIDNTITIALVTVIAIMERTTDDFLPFALIRFSTIMLGVGSAVVVNLFFLPPRFESKLFEHISEVTDQILKWIRLSSRHASEHGYLRDEIDTIENNLEKINQIYKFYKEERSFLKKPNPTKARKLVLYRQMIKTTEKGLEILKKLHRLENDLHQLPTAIEQLITSELDVLVHYHEQLQLKFVGKIKDQSISVTETESSIAKREMVENFFSRPFTENPDECTQIYHVLPLIGAVLEYSHHLEHLEHLISIYQQRSSEHEAILER